MEELGILPDEERGLAAMTDIPVTCLSTLADSIEEDNEKSKEEDKSEPVKWYDRGATRLHWSTSEWAKKQWQDVDLRVLQGWLQQGQIPPKGK
jgi:outer membrane protein assembly factor BamD (BamD/ComL family)